MIKKNGKFITILLLIVILVPLLILLLPFIFLLWIKDFFSQKLFDRKYRGFLKTLNGKTFFCINDRRDNIEYTKENISSKLPSGFEIIYLKNKIAFSRYETRYISHLLHSVKDRRGFPYLIKIENGMAIDESVNKQYYNIKHQKGDINKLIKQIVKF
jgi:hypothetical protein